MNETPSASPSSGDELPEHWEWDVFWTFWFHPVVVITMAIATLSALFYPHLLVDHVVIQKMGAFASLYSNPNGMAQASKYHDAALVFYTIVFCLFPIQTVILLHRFLRKDHLERMRNRIRQLPRSERRKIMLGGLGLLPLGSYFGVMWVATDPSVCLGCTTQNMFGMFLITWVEIGFFLWVLAAAVVLATICFSGQTSQPSSKG